MNYIYFLLLYFAVGGLSLLALFTKNLSPITPALITYNMGQSLLIVLFFLFLFESTKKQWLKNFYATGCFSFWMVQFTNFHLSHLMDTSLLYLLRFFIGRGFSHIIRVFQAINMNQVMGGFILVALLTIPLLAIFIYKITDAVSQKYPIRLSKKRLLGTFFIAAAGLFCIEWQALPSFSYTSHKIYEKTLPLARTWKTPPVEERMLQSCVALPPIPTFLASKQNPLADKPNIYLFIIETLRHDFITANTTPHLTFFQKKHIGFENSFANANATQQSWFSILHSQFPYHWVRTQKESTQGSAPLRLLKQLGYRIHVYSSADLRYFEMDRLLFGSERELLDEIQEYEASMPAWQRDFCALQDFENTIAKPESQEGNVFIFFLDATHSEYSFPPDFALAFTPITNKIDYLSFEPSHLEKMQNRYRNSCAYVDCLMGQFFATLASKGLYEKALIAITGDHGEEFFEEGALFHGTHLNHYQTHVPILLKLHSVDAKISATNITHIDIFPSIFHSLFQKEMPLNAFDGRSIFSVSPRKFRLATLQNGAQTPQEFLITDGVYEVRGHFADPDNLYTSKKIHIISETASPQEGDPFQILYVSK